MKAKRGSKRRLNVTGLALALGVNRSNLSGHLKRPDAPRRDKSGCYALTAVRRYLADRRRLNNDAGAGGEHSVEIFRLRAEKLSLEVESLRRELQLTGTRISTDELKTWATRLLWQVKISLPSRFRPSLVMALLRLPGVTASPVDVLRCCQDWGDGVCASLQLWCAANGIEITLAGKPETVALGPILANVFSETRITPSAVPSAVPGAEVLLMFSEFIEALRSVGVEEAQIREAGNAVTITDARARR